MSCVRDCFATSPGQQMTHRVRTPCVRNRYCARGVSGALSVVLHFRTSLLRPGHAALLAQGMHNPVTQQSQ